MPRKTSNNRRRSFARPKPFRALKPVFYISVEGHVTEPQYFRLFRSKAVVHIKLISDRNHGAPLDVLARLEAELEDVDVRLGDEAWLVVDRDSWSEEHLNTLSDWADKEEWRGLALSNPCFEFWLLLHFEDSKGACSKQKCRAKLKSHLKDFKKDLPRNSVSEQAVADAVSRAIQLDSPPCTSWPKQSGRTTVYRLVEKLRSFS